MDRATLRMALAGYEHERARILDAITELQRRLTPRPPHLNKRRCRARAWSKRDLDRLRSLYSAQPLDQVAAILRRTATSVKSKANVLGLKTGRRKVWSEDELAKLCELYPALPTKEVALTLGRTVSSVNGAAGTLGLEKSPEFWKNWGKFFPPPAGFIAAQYPKGHTPANKGVKRPGWSAGRMKETQFKKGNKPHTWHPIGTVLPDADGYLRIKVRERTPKEVREAKLGGWHPKIWPALHRKTWEEHHGPIPRGRIVVFKDGNKQNCAIENLELITLKENMRRNTIWNRLPRELAEVIQLTDALKRKLRRLDGEKQNHGPAGSPVRDARSA